jgi:hypothetical protein
MWKTGKYCLSDVKADNHFSSDNWGTRTKEVSKSVLGLPASSWEAIFDAVHADMHPAAEEEVDDDTADLERDFQLLRSDADFDFDMEEVDEL